LRRTIDEVKAGLPDPSVSELTVCPDSEISACTRRRGQRDSRSEPLSGGETSRAAPAKA